MKAWTKKVINKLGFSIHRTDEVQFSLAQSLQKIYTKYQSYTMIPKNLYIGNLILCRQFLTIKGNIVECGVWRGGMMAGIAEMAEMAEISKKYYLFDSFEGLPQAKEIDGKAALEWQRDTNDENYFNNCNAEIDFAIEAMNLAHVDFKLVKGWFNETLPTYRMEEPIAILRLDGDWYESTMDCLKYLYPKVNTNGIIILDDYFIWDGCSRAVHDYLSSISSTSRIYTSEEGVCYILKNDEYGTT